MDSGGVKLTTLEVEVRVNSARVVLSALIVEVDGKLFSDKSLAPVERAKECELEVVG